ncbi:MAG: hypothetical protein ANABAC_2601 [Anaerolineae bacterium]|nr:MAG: hypothetical protein ANABAC_2601 [Anaerolineae bacterium]
MIFSIFYAILDAQMSGCPPHPGICIFMDGEIARFLITIYKIFG